jgi:DNA-binding PadR family transcriptional regulator
MSDRELLLLGLLHQQEMHGYRLYEFIESELSFCTDLKKSTAYYLLDRLAEKGWVEQEPEQAGKRPTRNVYHLTAAGEQAYRALLEENLAASHQPAFNGDIGVAFLESLPPHEAADLLRQRRDAFAERLRIAAEAPEHEGPAQWVVDHQRTFLQHELAWTDELLSRLEP